MKCVQCGAEFEQTRRDRKYCSKACYYKAYRAGHLPARQAIQRRYQQRHREELRWKHKVYRLTGKWLKGKVS